MGGVVQFDELRHRRRIVYFSRSDMNQLLGLFSRRVQSQQWLDYSIDNRPGSAVFCVYRRAWDAPLYRIYKFAPGTYPGGDYMVMRGIRQLAHDHRLHGVLGIFRPALKIV